MINAIWLSIFLGMSLTAGLAQEKPKALFESGIEYYRAGDYPRAITAFKEIIKKSIDPTELREAFIYLGYTYFSLPDEENAKIQIEHAIELELDLDYSPKVEDGFSAEFIELYKKIKESLVGIVFFDSDPSPSVVKIDGKDIGKTPFKKELLAKAYEARIVRAGYEVCTEAFEIKKGEIISVNVMLRDARNWKTFLRSTLAMVFFSYLLRYI